MGVRLILSSNLLYGITDNTNNNSGSGSGSGSSEGGTYDHDKLNNRDLPNQHPIDSIIGLRAELEKFYSDGDTSKNFYYYKIRPIRTFEIERIVDRVNLEELD